MGVDVLQHQLSLLKGLETPRPDVPGGRLDDAVHGGGQVPGSSLSLATCLDPPAFDHAGEEVAGLGLAALQNVRQVAGGCSAISGQLTEDLKPSRHGSPCFGEEGGDP